MMSPSVRRTTSTGIAVLLLERRAEGVELVEALARVDGDAALLLGGGDELLERGVGVGRSRLVPVGCRRRLGRPAAVVAVASVSSSSSPHAAAPSARLSNEAASTAVGAVSSIARGSPSSLVPRGTTANCS